MQWNELITDYGFSCWHDNSWFFNCCNKLKPRWWCSGLERYHRIRNVVCSNPSRERIESLKRVLAAHCHTLGICLSVMVLWRWPLKTDARWHIRYGTLKSHHCSMAKSAEHRPKFAALRRNLWRFPMSENFSSGTKNLKQTNSNFDAEWNVGEMLKYGAHV